MFRRKALKLKRATFCSYQFTLDVKVSYFFFSSKDTGTDFHYKNKLTVHNVKYALELNNY